MSIKSWKKGPINDVKVADYQILTKAHDFMKISMNNGYAISIEKEGKHVKCLIVMPDQEILFSESEKESFSQTELEEIFKKMSEKELINSNIDTEKDTINNLKSIAALNLLNRKYMGNDGDKMLSAKIGAFDFIKMANEYFEEIPNEGEEKKQTLTFVNPGNSDIMDAFNVKASFDSKKPEIILVQSDEKDINKFTKYRDDNEGIIEEPYIMDNRFFKYMKKVKGDNTYDKAFLSYAMYTEDAEASKLQSSFFTMQNFRKLASLILKNKDILKQEDILKETFYFLEIAMKYYQTFSRNEISTYYNDVKNQILSAIKDKTHKAKLEEFFNKMRPQEIDFEEIAKILEQDDRPYDDKSSEEDISSAQHSVINDADKSKTNKQTNKKKRKLNVKHVALTTGGIVALTVGGGVLISNKNDKEQTYTEESSFSSNISEDLDSEDLDSEEYIPLRADHSDSSNMVNVIKNKFEISIPLEADKYVEYDNVTWIKTEDGWLNDKYLDDPRYFVNAREEAQEVNLRSLQYTDAEIITKIPDGAKIKILGDVISTRNNGAELKNWYNIEYIDKEGKSYSGYIAAKYIQGVYTINTDIEQEQNIKEESLEVSNVTTTVTVDNNGNAKPREDDHEDR